MPWLSKRELAAYILLRKVFGDNVFNLGEALDVLKPLANKKLAIKLIKRLRSKGFLERIDVFNYRARSIEEALAAYLARYVAHRVARNLRSWGVEAKAIDVGASSRIDIPCNAIDREVLDSITAIANTFGIQLRCIEEA